MVKRTKLNSKKGVMWDTLLLNDDNDVDDCIEKERVLQQPLTTTPTLSASISFASAGHTAC